MLYSLLPPEINSLRMYTGAGAGPLVAAAASWSQIANGLSDAAMQHVATVTALAGVWTGPSSDAMLKSSLAYTKWLTSTAAQAEVTATQAQAAVAAYETAFAATVPPFEVTENRARLTALVATNFLGVNTPVIMATEAQYSEMWAQDAAAMTTYQVSSMQATRLPSFTPLKPLTTNVAQQPKQLPQGGIQNALQGLQNIDPTTGWLGLFNDYIQSNLSSGVLFDVPLGVIQSITSTVALMSLFQGEKQIAIGEAQLPPEQVAQIESRFGGGMTGGLNTAASFGNAQSVGKLSVPQSWERSASLPFTNPEPVSALNTGEGYFGPPVTPLLGRREKPEPARYGFRQKKLIPRHPSGG
ncbi:PPE family protein [Mycobacterium colombiense]|uniref:PPE family protein n=1 Tax=Mycobacterium colombiense TaxID=339268 RepID=A0A329MCB7_9MYCO|nr:PPE family protein [Mycobacterium colombiense]RAV17470.1 PPE family protein [Mycobacterium colombiense]